MGGVAVASVLYYYISWPAGDLSGVPLGTTVDYAKSAVALSHFV